MYDAIVVGARCAGSPTAMLLARKGYRVLLVDKATFPSDTLSTHYIHPTGMARLKRWDLLDQVMASNCPPVSRAYLDLGSFSLAAATLPVEGVTAAYAPRRRVLDKILVDAALEAGAELREGFHVQELLLDGDRVVGIRGQGSGGTSVDEKAGIVVGADGMRSLVARTVQAPMYHSKPALSCAYYAYWSGVPMEGIEMYQREHCMIVAFPTNDDLVVIFMAWLNREFHAVRADIEGNFLKTLELAPGLLKRVRGGRREERFAGTADLPNFFRKPYGPGWALVGDAGYHKDPALAHGISDAFRDAELVTEAIDAGLSGRCPLEEAMADYEQRRNEVGLPIYEVNSQFASQEPPSAQMQLLLQALRPNPIEIDGFFAALEGTISPAAFFAPENVARIIGAAKLQACAE